MKLRTANRRKKRKQERAAREKAWQQFVAVLSDLEFDENGIARVGGLTIVNRNFR